jgi:hypothetical protein
MGWTSYKRPTGQRDLDHLRSELTGPNSRCELLDGMTVHNVFYGALRLPDGTVSGLVVLQHRNRGENRYDGSNYARKEIEETAGPVDARCPARILALLTPLPECEHPETYCAHCGSEIHQDGEQWVSRARPGQVPGVAGPRCYSGYPASASQNGQPPFHKPGGTAPCGTCQAREWRERCQANIDRAAAHTPLKTGDTFTVEKPWEFADGVNESTFTLTNARRRTFRRACDRRAVKLPERAAWPPYTVQSQPATSN